MSSDAPHPSLLNRVARRLRRARDRTEAALEALREEAASPGEPPPHRRPASPLHAEAADRAAAAVGRSPEGAPRYDPGGDPSLDPYARPAQDEAAPDDAWYLRDEREGWRRTNPGGDDA